MGGICAKSTAGASTLPGPVSSNTFEKKWVAHDGKFINDEDAFNNAETWCKLPENKGWSYKGKYKHEGEVSMFEVVSDKPFKPSAPSMPPS